MSQVRQEPRLAAERRSVPQCSVPRGRWWWRKEGPPLPPALRPPLLPSPAAPLLTHQSVQSREQGECVRAVQEAQVRPLQDTGYTARCPVEDTARISMGPSATSVEDNGRTKNWSWRHCVYCKKISSKTFTLQESKRNQVSFYSWKHWEDCKNSTWCPMDSQRHSRRLSEENSWRQWPHLQESQWHQVSLFSCRHCLFKPKWVHCLSQEQESVGQSDSQRHWTNWVKLPKQSAWKVI